MTTSTSTMPSFVGFLYGFWLFIVIFVFFLTNGTNFYALEVALLFGIFPVVFQLITYDLIKTGWHVPIYFMLSFLIVIVFGFAINGAVLEDFVYVFNVGLIFIIAMSLSGCRDRNIILEMSLVYAIFTVPFLIYVNLTQEYVWGRLTGNLHPNLWGLIAASLACSAVAFRNKLIVLICWSTALITVFNSGARGSMVAILGAILITLFYWFRHEEKLYLTFRILFSILCVSAVIFLVIIFQDFIMNDVFKAHDTGRGLGSGGTGRIEAFSEAFEIWMSSPVLGVGFNKHQQYLTTLSSAHNAFLGTLADTGILGLLVYLCFLICAVVATLRGIADSHTRYLILVIIASYFLLGLFEKRALNTGNPFSILFIISCVYALQIAKPKPPVREQVLTNRLIG
jgi:O-antigen ligase